MVIPSIIVMFTSIATSQLDIITDARLTSYECFIVGKDGSTATVLIPNTERAPEDVVSKKAERLFEHHSNVKGVAECNNTRHLPPKDTIRDFHPPGFTVDRPSF